MLQEVIMETKNGLKNFLMLCGKTGYVRHLLFFRTWERIVAFLFHVTLFMWGIAFIAFSVNLMSLQYYQKMALASVFILGMCAVVGLILMGMVKVKESYLRQKSTIRLQ